MKIRVAVVLGLVAASLAAVPAPFTLEGVVRDRLLRTPIEGATIALVRARRSATSGEDGTFRFGDDQVAAGDQVVITHPDYRTVRLSLGSLGSNAWRIEIAMVREAATVLDSIPGNGR